MTRAAAWPVNKMVLKAARLQQLSAGVASGGSAQTRTETTAKLPALHESSCALGERTSARFTETRRLPGTSPLACELVAMGVSKAVVRRGKFRQSTVEQCQRFLVGLRKTN